jgi:hypothetical protein
MGKYTRGNVGGLQKHNQRENKNYGNENIDITKSNQNYDLQNHENIKYLNKIDSIIKENRSSDKAVRKDAIVYVDTVVGSDKEFFNNLSDQEKRKFFEQSYEYLKNKVGEKNIVSATVHMDETKGVGGSPHMHFSFVPMNADGTLSAKKKINRNFLREIQDEFPKVLKNKGFNIERGMENSTKKHLEPLEFKKQQIQKDIQQVNKQIEGLEKRININTKDIKKGLLGYKSEDVESLIAENKSLKLKLGSCTYNLEKANHDIKSFKETMKDARRINETNFELYGKYKDLEIENKRLNKALDMVVPNKEARDKLLNETTLKMPNRDNIDR